MNKKTFSIFAIGFLCAFALSGSTAHAATLTNPQNSLGLVGYWPMDSVSGTTVPDRSGNGNNGTTSGSPTAAAGKIGKALNFSGSQYVAVPMTINYSAITVSAWIKPSTVSAGNSRILANSHTDQDHKGFQLWFNNGGTTGVFDVGNGSSEGAVYWSSTLIPGNWYLYTGVYDGTHVYVYINGVQVGSANYAGGSIAASGYSLNIGRNPTYGGDYFRGVIDDARVYNRALSATEVANLYQNTLSVSTRSSSPTNLVTNGLVGYWTFDGANTNWGSNTTADVSGNGYTGTMVNMSTTSSPVMGRFGQALSFNGTGQYVSVPSVGLTGAFTFSLWYKATTNSQIGMVLGGLPPYSYGAKIGIVNGSYFVRIISGGTSDSSVSAASVGAWHSLVITRDTGGIVYLTVDGLQRQLFSGVAQTGTFTLGGIATDFGSDQRFNGSIDDVRVYNRALSASEVKQLYNAGAPASAAVVGQVPVHALSGGGLIGYWPFDGNSLNWATNQALDMSGNGNTGTLINMSTTTSPVPGKIGQALNFNNTGTVSINNSASTFNFGTNDFSLSIWFKLASESGTQLFSKYNGNSYPHYNLYLSNSNPRNYCSTGKIGLAFSLYNGPQTMANAGCVTEYVWHHVTGVRSGTSILLYLDGTLAATSTTGTPTSYDNPGPFVVGGQQYQGAFAGILDDARVYNRALSASEVKTLYNLGR